MQKTGCIFSDLQLITFKNIFFTKKHFVSDLPTGSLVNTPKESFFCKQMVSWGAYLFYKE